MVNSNEEKPIEIKEHWQMPTVTELEINKETAGGGAGGDDWPSGGSQATSG